MTKPIQKGYRAPWSNRREMVGLMGTFFVFLLGLPGHSELTVSSARHVARQLIQLILVFLGLSTPVVQAPTAAIVAPVAPVRIAAVHKKPMVRSTPVQPDINSMFLRSEPVLHRFTYIFEGKATLHNEPCASASVLVRLISGDRVVAKGDVTDVDGSYSITIPIDAEIQAPVDWTVEAYTADFNKVELFGRKIVQREEDLEKQPIVVTNPVEFVVSLSK